MDETTHPSNTQWGDEDEFLVRSAMLTLRPDHREVHLDAPDSIRGQGQVLKRRRAFALTAGVAAAVAIVATLGFRGLAHEDAAPPPVPASPTPTVVPSVPPTTPSMTASPTATPSVTATATSRPTARSTSTGASKPSSTSTPGPSSVVPPPPAQDPGGSRDCGITSRTANTTGVPAAASQTAREVMAWAMACDDEAVISRFVEDATDVSFNGTGISGSLPERLSLPDYQDRYELLTTLLPLPPGPLDAEGFFQWPKAPKTDAEWQRLVDLGLISPETKAQGQADGAARIPFVVIAGTGQFITLTDGL